MTVTDPATGSRDATGDPPQGGRAVPLEVLEEIQRRVLWLAVRMVDHANRRDAGGIKVGGHQASSASMVSVMTALWFGHIGGQDKVAVKPHAAPVYHAIKYLTGELDRSQLLRLRELGGLQAYPSRTKDPDVADFSTGSVGLGAVAPLFSALARRYVDARFGPRPPARFYALVGDAELDEGNVWEAIADPATDGLGNVALVVDLNRQSLDRVVPAIQARRLEGFFADAGWHVVEAKYGRRLRAAFAEPGGDALRRLIDDMPNEQYQALFRLRGPELREAVTRDADPDAVALLGRRSDEELARLVFDLGGHDLAVLLDAYRRADAVTDRPSVVFAYTIKGWGLPIAGDPLNHAALLTPDQIDELRRDVGLTPDTEWDRFDPGSPEGRWCSEVGGEINNEAPPPRPRPRIPVATGAGRPGRRPVSTQEVFGRVLTALADDEEVARRLVTTSPDVSISTNLGGWINRTGVFSPVATVDHGGGDSVLRWVPSPEGHHIELGISEMNLFLLLGQLGLAHEHHGEMLLPVGTVYDPFVLRGLDAFVYGLYNGSRFVVVGTPSGVTLAPEGGAHQSTITPSVGVELPGVTFCEPAYGLEVDWLLCDALRRLAEPDGDSTYLRLSTLPVDQSPLAEALERRGTEAVRADAVAGAHRLVEPAPDDDRPRVVLAASGVAVHRAVEAARTLDDEGVAASVIDMTSPDRLFRRWQRSRRRAVRSGRRLDPGDGLGALLVPAEHDAPLVSVHDASSHTLAWLGSALGLRQVALGVDEFGQSGTVDELHRVTGIDADHVVNAALAALVD